MYMCVHFTLHSYEHHHTGVAVLYSTYMEVHAKAAGSVGERDQPLHTTGNKSSVAALQVSMCSCPQPVLTD